MRPVQREVKERPRSTALARIRWQAPGLTVSHFLGEIFWTGILSGALLPTISEEIGDA